MKKRVTQAEFARICGVNRSTVSKWIKNERIQVDERGLIDPAAAAAMRAATESPMPHHQARKAQFEEARMGGSANPAEKTAQRAATPAEPMPQMEKLGAALKLETYKLQKAKAEQANMELDKMAGLLVERAEVDYVLADFGNTLRALMEGLPDRLAGSVSRHRGDVGAIHKEIADAAHDLLNEMADLMKRKMETLTP